MNSAPRRPLSPATPAALFDSLRYPLLGGALAALVTLSLVRVAASFVPLVGLLIDLVTWLAVYKYGLEVLAASGLGKREAPEVLAHVDASVHNRHLGVQILLSVLLVGSLRLFPEAAVVIVIGAAIILPGLVLALAVSQNLVAALIPLNWAVVAGKLGLGYPMLALGWLAALWFQIIGYELFAPLPDVIALLLFYLASHYLLIALFRWMGLFLHAHGDSLGFATRATAKPILARDREQQAIQREVRAANEVGDPAARADQLRDAVRRGAAQPVQQAYREALRAAGRREELLEHARVRCSELLVLQQHRDAVMLASEALQDDPGFTLPERAQLNLLLAQLRQAAQWQTAATLARNYRRQYPNRRDSIDAGIDAAVLLADRLGEPAQAQALLRELLPGAEAQGVAESVQRLLARLDSGFRLGE